jgi:hypothetical protein
MKAELRLATCLVCILLFLPVSLVAQADADETTVYLQDINSATTTPPGNFRWLDVADQAYSDTFLDGYNYSEYSQYAQATVEVTYETVGIHSVAP